MMLGELNAGFPWGVLLVTDRDATDPIPTWATPEEQVTSSRTAAVVRVRHQDEGSVIVRVLDDGGGVPGAVAFEGELAVPSGVLRVSDAVGDEAIELGVSERILLGVYVDSAVEASAVTLVLTPVVA